MVCLSLPLPAGIRFNFRSAYALEYARRQRAEKRGGTTPDLSLSQISHLPAVQAEEVLGLHDALDQLETFDERQARIVELRYLCRLSNGIVLKPCSTRRCNALRPSVRPFWTRSALMRLRCARR